VHTKLASTADYDKTKTDLEARIEGIIVDLKLK
jgi:hypothetical protein